MKKSTEIRDRSGQKVSGDHFRNLSPVWREWMGRWMRNEDISYIRANPKKREEDKR